MGIEPPALQQLDVAFRRRGMQRHVRALERQQLAPTLVVEWLRLLKIPPHENDYPVLPRGAPCPRCGSISADRTATGTIATISFPGGWLETCLGCRMSWLHAERF
jgi:hypothetical protein